MAGGVWLSQNKVRPGAYINFRQVAKPLLTVGDRGIATVALPLSWGPSDVLIDVESSELLNGDSRAKLGFTAADTADSLVARLILSNCYRCLFYRLDSGGVQASGTISGFAVTAKYPGKAGNKITVQINKNKVDTTKYNFLTFWDGVLVHSQEVKSKDEVQSNDYIDVTTDSGQLKEAAGVTLTSGSDGTVSASAAYPKYFELLEVAKWQTMAIITDGSTINALAKTFIENQREDEGRGVQLCIYEDASTYNYEGVIASEQSLIFSNETVPKEMVPAWVAGITAGAQINQSNTYKVVEGAIGFAPEHKDSVIKEKLKLGKFLFSTRQDGNIVVEKDINTYHLFEPEKGYVFSKNRAIRVMDEMRMSIRSVWENNYIGKVTNNNRGRAIFKADVVAYITELQRLETVEASYDPVENTIVERGVNVDAVRASVNRLPILDAMEILYMDIEVLA